MALKGGPMSGWQLARIRVLAVDDRPLVREGIAGLVAGSAGYDVGRRSRATVATRSSNSGRTVRT